MFEPECYNDGDCPPTHSCIDGTCVYQPECINDWDCPSGFRCIDGQCIFEPECFGDWDCPDGFQCVDGICIPGTACLPDDYERDNDWTRASPLAPAAQQTHSICPAGDEDWWIFDLEAATGITLQTLGSAGDTVLYLYDENLQQIAYDDDGGPGLFSLLELPSLWPGRFYVKVTEWSPSAELDNYIILLSTSGACVPDCTGRNCGPDPVCGESCGVCDDGWLCNNDNGQCVYSPECFNDNDCPGDFYHCIGGQCIYQDPCQDVWCDPGWHCESGECVHDTCQGNGDCPLGQFCISGYCQGQQCSGNQDCPANQWCIMGYCIQACFTGDECPENYVCENFFCVYDPCADVSCPPNLVCIDGACVAP